MSHSSPTGAVAGCPHPKPTLCAPPPPPPHATPAVLLGSSWCVSQIIVPNCLCVFWVLLLSLSLRCGPWAVNQTTLFSKHCLMNPGQKTHHPASRTHLEGDVPAQEWLSYKDVFYYFSFTCSSSLRQEGALWDRRDSRSFPPNTLLPPSLPQGSPTFPGDPHEWLWPPSSLTCPPEGPLWAAHHSDYTHIWDSSHARLNHEHVPSHPAGTWGDARSENSCPLTTTSGSN